MLKRISQRSSASPGKTGGEDSAIIFITHLWVLIGSLFTQGILAWVLGPNDRGSFAVCILFGVLSGLIFSLGAERGTQYFVMSKRISLSQGVWGAVIVNLLGSCVAMALGWFLIKSPLEFFQKADPSAFKISLLLIPFTGLLAIVQLQMAGLRKFFLISINSILQTLINLLLIVGLVWGANLGVHGALIAQVASTFLIICLYFWQLREYCGLTFSSPNLTEYKLILSYGVRIYFARIGQRVDMGLGTLILAMFATREEIGLFAAGSALVLKVLIIAKSIETSLLPRVAADQNGRVDLVGQCMRLSSLFVGGALALIVIFSVPLVRIVLSPEFLPSVPLIWILTPGILVHGGTNIFMAYFRGINRPGLCSLAVWVGLTVNAVSFIFLYPLLGLPGAALGMTIGFVSRGLVLFVGFTSISGSSVLDTIIFRRDDFILVQNLILGIYGRVLSFRKDPTSG